MSLDRSRLRADTPGCAHQHFFDAAGAALMPQPVLDTMHRHLDLEARVGGYRAADLREDDREAAYDAFAALLHCHRRNIAFVENATAGFSQALSAFDPGPGDVIVTTENDYVSSHMAFLSLKERRGVEIRLLPEADAGGFDVDRAADCIAANRPKLVTVAQVPTGSGLIQPVAELGAICAAQGVPLLVDGCQSIGQLDIDFRALNCAVFTASTRKFLRGPRGMGVMVVSDDWLGKGLAPIHPDLHGGIWTATDQYRLRDDARRFENWEFNHAALLGAGAAAEYALSIGMPAIEAKLMELGADLRRSLKSMAHVRVVDRGSRVGAIVTVAMPGLDPQAVSRSLLAAKIAHTLSFADSSRYDYAAKGIEWTVRLSPHVYNNDQDFQAAAEAVEALVG